MDGRLRAVRRPRGGLDGISDEVHRRRAPTSSPSRRRARTKCRRRVERFVIRTCWTGSATATPRRKGTREGCRVAHRLASLKGTPLVDAADDNKLVFASSYLTPRRARVVKEEGEYLSEWKVAKIVEAAGPQHPQPRPREDLHTRGDES